MRKGNVLLLALFMVAFIVSIIGLMYSYNKRILILAAQERKNYQKTSLLIREAIMNVYLAKELVKGYNIEGLGSLWISHVKNMGGTSLTFNFSWTDRDSSNTLALEKPNFYGNPPTGITQPTSEGSKSLDISGYIGGILSQRNALANELKDNVKGRVEDYIRKTFEGFDYTMEGEEEWNNIIDDNNSSAILRLTYRVNIEKVKGKGKKENLKISYLITVEYNISIGFTSKATPSITGHTATAYEVYDPTTGVYTTYYDHNATVQTNINTTSKLDAKLLEFDIKRESE